MLRFCLFTLLVLLSAVAASRAVQAESAPAAIDLATVSLAGEDFASIGWDDLAFVSDWRPTAAGLADRAVWPAGAGKELDAVKAGLIAAGWEQSFAAAFAAPPDLDHGVPGRQAEVEIVAYGDDSGAEAGFALIPDAFPTGPIAAVTGSRAIGEESRLVRVAARDPQAGTPNQELVLGFRSGRFTARILLRDWSGEEPDVVTIEELGSGLATRIAQEATRQVEVGQRIAWSESAATSSRSGTTAQVAKTRDAVSLQTRCRGRQIVPRRYDVGPKTCTRSFSVSAT